MGLTMGQLRARLLKLPWLTIGLIGGLGIIYYVQLQTMPVQCSDTSYPAFCAGATLIQGNAFIGFLVAPVLHGSLVHLGLNLAMFAVFGSVVERLRGPLEYAVLVFVSGYLSLEAHLLSEVVTTGAAPIIMGASGAGYTLAGFTGIYYLHKAITMAHGEWGAERRWQQALSGLYGVVAILVVGYGASQLFTSLPASDAGQTAVVAHIAGAVIGIGWALAVRSG